MEEEIEVGEWIRSKNGFIGKVQKINYDNMEKSNYYICEKDNVMSSNYLENIVKHSKQLIYLIEVGDIVKDKYNKYEVAFVKNDKIYCNDYNLDDSLITLREQDIKAILTKEQFAANCYKVGGE